MGLRDWNWKLPAELQDVPWDCACASITWALNSISFDVTEQEVASSMHPLYVNEAYGLLDASGAGLVEWLGTRGINAENNPDASWSDILAAAGWQPMVMGGRNWCHWTGVRISSQLLVPDHEVLLALANPAPGWMGIDQLMTEDQFLELGPFSAVWFASW